MHTHINVALNCLAAHAFSRFFAVVVPTLGANRPVLANIAAAVLDAPRLGERVPTSIADEHIGLLMVID